jgi:hypothetical protein
VAVFDFLDFARTIYSENPGVYEVPMSLRAQVNANIDSNVVNVDALRIAIEEKFLLPALYGGDASDGDMFEALVVLEAPARPFTKERWKTPCATPEEAVSRHRKIFFEWAFRGLQAELFYGLVGRPPTPEIFFRRLYITDVWKDAAFSEKNPSYEHYWQSKLEKEIRSVATEHVIFVGAPARDFGQRYVPKDKHAHSIDFPSNRTQFKAQLPGLLAEFQTAAYFKGLTSKAAAEETDLENALSAASQEMDFDQP